MTGVFIRFLVLVWLTAFFQAGSSAQSFFRVGAADDVQTSPSAGLLLAGGATDNDDAMKWFLQQADGGDVVVIRATGTGSYNNYLYSGLGVSVNSVTTIVIPSRLAAENPEVAETLLQAEALFIAGGNQWHYVNYWKDSPVHEAIQYLVNEKGITVGGTSAGLAILGEVVFTAENNTVWSSEALSDPYHFRVKLDREFLSLPFMEQLITDSHYNRPESDGMDRKGRHMAFMARMVTDWNMQAKGIGVNEYTAVAVDAAGKARVFGHPQYDDFAYFLKAGDQAPELCQEGEPLHWWGDAQAVKVYKIAGDFQANNWFSLENWSEGQGGTWYYWFVNQGVLVEEIAGESAAQIRFVLRHGVNEAPLQGVSVFLESQGEKITDANGHALFSDLETGQDLIWEASLSGYFSETGSISVSGAITEQTVFLYPDEGTFTDEITAGNMLVRLFPNPASQRLCLRFDNALQAAELEIVDMLGRTFMRSVVSAVNLCFETHQWPAGRYQLRIHLPDSSGVINTNKALQQSFMIVH